MDISNQQIVNRLKPAIAEILRGTNKYNRRYPKDIKNKIAEIVRKGESISELVLATGINQVTLSKWGQMGSPKMFKEIVLTEKIKVNNFIIESPSGYRVIIDNKDEFISIFKAL